MSDDPERQGGCQCGAVRYRVSGEAVMTALCHCTMCRRANAAPAVAWAMYARAQVEFVAGTLATYASSPGCERRFCARCGTQIGFTADYLPSRADRHHHRQSRRPRRRVSRLPLLGIEAPAVAPDR